MKYPTAPVSIGLSLGLAIGLLVASVVAFPVGQAQSTEPDKTLKLYFGHTGETGTFTFKRNGVYDQAVLNRMNKFLRDWRKDQPTRMDPHLFDLVWAIYQRSGSHDAIHVISAFRSPATNEMLRSRAGSGVAKNSQHRLGKAMDWYLTDVPLAKLRGIAMQMQGGGVGYYPRSGSPFVHTDTGNVRAWPRMTRQQLLALFPNGNTLHLPADGPPLPGYQLAVAHRNAASGTALAYLDTGSTDDDDTDRTGTDTSSNGWLKRVFRGKDQDVAAAAPAAAPAADAPQVVAAADETIDTTLPRQPRARPVAEGDGAIVLASLETRPVDSSVPLPKNRPVEAEDASAAADAQDAIASLTERMNQESLRSSNSASPIALAFAAASETPQPSEADRAILAAFAALQATGSAQAPDPVLTAALTRAAADANSVEHPPTLVVALADEEPTPMAEPESAVAVTDLDPGTTAGIVLAPTEPAVSYSGDEPKLVNLIGTQATRDPSAGQLAMPQPASGFLVAPEGASAVADLRGRSGPPVERFARNGETPAQKGFFTKLFASLVE